ncbi:hypothetical protein GmHk_10G028679 [Glycine max]|nr:hypothetical protein GmHk_10G028679 [Glycine max]
MDSLPASSPPPSPPLPPPPSDASTSSPPGAKKPVVHVDPATGKAHGPNRKKLRTYLGIVARDKVDVTYENWKEVPTAQKDLIWEDIQMCGKRHRPSKNRTLPPHVLSRGGYEYLEQKLLAEKTKKKLEEVAQSESIDGVIDPPSPVRRHVKWKMARTKKTGDMTTEAAKEITEKIDVFTAAIGCLEHPGRVRAAGAGVTIKHYFGSAPWTSRNSSSLPPEELQQLLTQQIRDQLEESITEKVTRQLMASFSQFQYQMQSRGLALPSEPLVKVGVEEVKDPNSPVPIPTDEVSLVGQTIHTFVAWPTHLVKSLSQQTAVSPAKPPQKPDSEVDDPLYLMTFTIPELFLGPYQVTWDATVFRVFNPDFPLYIKHEELSEIAHGGQCLSISVLQLWILHLTETSMRAGNSDIYGFLEPQSIQRSGQSQVGTKSYIKSWMQSSKRDVYLGAYLNGSNNYLKGIINSALKGLDDAPQPKSKAPARWIVVKYFNDPRPLEPERLKALRIQWAQYYLRVRAQS